MEEQNNPVVIVNGETWNEANHADFERAFKFRLQPGQYWYDSKSGMFGVIGHPSSGFLPTGLPFGTVAQNASNGNTGVLLNGRDITQQEWFYLNQICGTIIQPGNYWMDQYGNCGPVNNRLLVFNLRQLAAMQMRGGAGFAGGDAGGGDNFWSSGFSAGNWDDSSGYVNVPGYGPMGYDR